MTIALLLLLAALSGRGKAPAAEGTLRVTPADSLVRVSDRLARDASIREVVLEPGTYDGEWVIPPLAGDQDPAAHPLVIRPAEGARVVFDGAVPLPRAKAVKGHPGVFDAVVDPRAGEPPKIWEPEKRVRYLLAADRAAVVRFPASYLLDGFKMSLHTADGARPGKGAILASRRAFGISVRRPHVTVRGLAFRNFIARSKWSAAVEARAPHVTIERCDAENASFGFTLLSDDDALVDSTARDVGGGVYVAGSRDRVERNRFVKARDGFVVPTYPQDDTGIQAYHPAAEATIRGNLAVGFARGILIKATASPWIVEENTLIAAGAPEDAEYRHGFLATQWTPASSFRRNVIEGYRPPASFASSETGPGVERNCPGVADPGFVDPDGGDYRLAPDSPCRAFVEAGTLGAELRLERSDARAVARAASEAGQAARAGPVAIEAGRAERSVRTGDADEKGEPRAWHVDPAGRDEAAGTSDAPLKSVQAAVDRARPGDTVLLHPGIYADPVRIDRGGTEGRPITLRATARWKAIFDGARRHDEMIRLENAPYVVIQDLEIRWYRKSGLHVVESPDARVEGCRVWNAHFGGTWPAGNGVVVDQSPRFAGRGNVLFNQERGFDLRSSPNAVLTGNTAVAHLYAAARFIRSIEGSTCTNNNFAYQGNDAIAVYEDAGGAGRLRTFTLDYNNYGLTLVPGADEKQLPHLVPRDRDRHLRIESKAIVLWEEARAPFQRFRTLESWRAFSSLDVHSIFADPLFVDSRAGDFRVERNSPNRGAGESGRDIGVTD